MFSEILDVIMTKVEGAQGAIIMGMDGISLEKVSLEDASSLEAMAAEYTSLLRFTVSSIPEMAAGPLEEFIVCTGSRSIVVKMLTPEYFLLVLLSRDGNLGRARFELKKARYLLAKELTF
jgi:predicted regulator of Ras-like GTPase activity (Roadblock/LC7/MglB family)